MKFQTIILQFLTISSLTILGGCEGPTHEVRYNSQYKEVQNKNKTSNSWYPFYNPTGDPAYSYDPVY